MVTPQKTEKANNGPASPWWAVLIRLLPWAIFMLALTSRLIPGPRTIDDSYITYRYARNILAGEGFVYNPGERVLGTTTPLYTVTMVVLGVLTGGVEAPFPLLAMLVNALADALTCLLLFQIGQRSGFFYAATGAALVWAIAPFSVTFAIGGLETSLYVLLIVGAASAHMNGKHILMAFLASLALLTRPDALILIGPLVLDRAWQLFGNRQRPATPFAWRSILYELLAFGLPVSLWIGFSIYYFGSPLPHSIAAKSVAYHLKPEEGFIRLFQHYATPFMDNLTFGARWTWVIAALYLFLSIVGALQGWRANHRSWPFFAYPWLYFFTFALANPLIFRWYLTPPLPAYMLAILIGAEKLITDLSTFFARKKETPTNSPISAWVLICVVILAPSLLSLREWRLHPDHGLDRPAPNMAWYQVELLYQQAAELLAPEMQVAADNMPVLAAGDVGVLGFFTGTRILDTVGLNSPRSSQFYPLDPDIYVSNYAIPPDLIAYERPDFIVFLEIYGRAGLLKDARFQQAYTLRHKIPTDIYGSDGMLIFARNRMP